MKENQNIKLTPQQIKEILKDLLLLLESEGFEKPENTNLGSFYKLTQNIFEVILSKTGKQLTTQLNEYDKAESGEKIIALLKEENIEAMNLPMTSGFFEEGEEPEVDNTLSQFQIKIYNRTFDLYNNHLKPSQK